MTAYYNEIDKFAAQWLRELIKAGHIADGVVDERSIVDVCSADLEGYTQCHWFAGIGIWSYALRLAGVPDDYPVWTGSCPCFPAGTLVFTKRGQVPIEQVAEGDMVLTHKGRWRPVQAVGTEDGQPLVEVKGQGHPGLGCTPNHPFLTGDNEWTLAEDLPGKRWRTVAKIPPLSIPEFKIVKGVSFVANRWRAVGSKQNKTVCLGRFRSREEAVRERLLAEQDGRIAVQGAELADVKSLAFARFLGYWIGNGWVTGNVVLICGSKDGGSLLKEIMQEAGLTSYISEERTTMRAGCGSIELSRWLKLYFGHGAAGKKIPAWIHGASESYRDAFLGGYFEADGHQEKHAKRWATVSRALAIGTRMLLNQSGLSASITKRVPHGDKRIEGRLVSERPWYAVTAYENARSFKFDALHGIGLVRSVSQAGRGRVYNLAVDEDESYVADGVVVHNCQPWSAAGKQKGNKDERHLWPAFFRLIDECRPKLVLGEQVAGSNVVGNLAKTRTPQDVERALEETGFEPKDADRPPWLYTLQSDMEGAGYRVGHIVAPACGFGAPHQRRRLYWCAQAVGVPSGPGSQQGRQGSKAVGHGRTVESGGRISGLANAPGSGRQEEHPISIRGGSGDREKVGAAGLHSGRDVGKLGDAAASGQPSRAGLCDTKSTRQRRDEPADRGGDSGLADTDGERLQRQWTHGGEEGREESDVRPAGFCDGTGPSGGMADAQCDGGRIDLEGRETQGRDADRGDSPSVGDDGLPGPTNGFWRDVDWLFCRDGKWRPAQSLDEPLADGTADLLGYRRIGGRYSLDPLQEKAKNRTMRLRGYGNAIVPMQAAAFIKAVMEATATAPQEQKEDTPC